MSPVEIPAEGAAAVELEIARRFYNEGFASVRVWVWILFDRYMDIEGEVRRILTPDPEDKLLRQVQGALRQVVTSQGVITPGTIPKAAQKITAHLTAGGIRL